MKRAQVLDATLGPVQKMKRSQVLDAAFGPLQNRKGVQVLDAAFGLIRKMKRARMGVLINTWGQPKQGKGQDVNINMIWPGKEGVSGVDSVGTVLASLVTCASIQALRQDLIINTGTSDGFKAKGACFGDVFLVTGVAFHDRRIPNSSFLNRVGIFVFP
ncbi:hypothetical protein IFM89_015624 [Coptis chinensis]|uniref:Uncharacterized protein n=1 Tax=Coptis chinensis TaxID=261450 RepID=A0A835M026_9MAGN|nr:hypothetical protein IFM89_015624 [Coptis chinensis]